MIGMFQKRFSSSWEASTPLPRKRARSPCPDDSMHGASDVEPLQSDDAVRDVPASKDTHSGPQGRHSSCPNEQESSPNYSAEVAEKWVKLYNSSTCFRMANFQSTCKKISGVSIANCCNVHLCQMYCLCWCNIGLQDGMNVSNSCWSTLPVKRWRWCYSPWIT